MRARRIQRRSVIQGRLTALEGILASSVPYWFRAEPTTGNVSTAPNRGYVGGALSVTGGVLAAPVVDGSLGGKLSWTFTGTQWLDFVGPASAWAFMHNGAGFRSYVVFVPTAANTQIILATRGSAVAAGNHIYHTSVGYATSICNDTILTYNVTGATTILNTAGLHEVSYASAPATKVEIRAKGSLVGSSSAAATPSVADPTGPLRVGASVSGTTQFNGRIADILIEQTVSGQRSLIYEYVSARYGIVAQ